MMRALIAGLMLAGLLAGCASVPMADKAESNQAKLFSPPSEGKAGLYVYRDSNFGASLKKDIYVDDHCLGKSAPHVFFHTEVDGDKTHVISTESEFSPNKLSLYMKAGINYFVRQYIKMGVFVGGSNLEVIDEEKGKQAVGGLDMATSGKCGG